MSQKTFSFIAGIIFLVVAILHFGMFVLGKSVIVGDWPTPVLSNLVISLIAGYFAYQGLRLSRKAQ
jgi:hypothetical protein